MIGFEAFQMRLFIARSLIAQTFAFCIEPTLEPFVPMRTLADSEVHGTPSACSVRKCNLKWHHAL